jgi:hypothetical protein
MFKKFLIPFFFLAPFLFVGVVVYQVWTEEAEFVSQSPFQRERGELEPAAVEKIDPVPSPEEIAKYPYYNPQPYQQPYQWSRGSSKDHDDDDD